MKRNKDLIVLRGGGDIDCIVKKNKLAQIKKRFLNNGFIFEESRWNSIHAKQITSKYQDYHFYIGGVPYNHILLLNEKYFFNKDKKIAKLLGLLLHLVIDKESVSGKRQEELHNSFKRLSKSERNHFFSICGKEYGPEITQEMNKITSRKEVDVRHLKWKIIFKKSNSLQLLGLLFVLVSNQIYKFKQKKKRYTISFLGVDGSGKTTSIENLCKYLESNNIKYLVGNLGVYHDRSSFMKFLSKFVKTEKNEKKAVEKLNINYTQKSFLKNLVRLIDIFIRYKKTIKVAKKNGSKIIIFDRYFYDLILQSKLDFFTKILLKIVPKPRKLFFLYSSPERIFKRKRERNIQVLGEQINKFRGEIEDISSVREIETKTEKQTLSEVLRELNNKEFLSCI